MVAEMRSGQGMRTRALSLVAGQLSHNALPLRPSPPYIIFGMANGWIVETLDATVTAEVEALPADVHGRLNRVVGLIQSLGLGRVGMPHVKHIEGKLWEIRATGRDGIARALYVTTAPRRVIVLCAFVKKTQKTPRREIELALRRARVLA